MGKYSNTLPKKRAIHKTQIALLSSSFETFAHKEATRSYTLVSSPFGSFGAAQTPDLNTFYAQQEGVL